jgi:bifunctional enzyme CysN/CysC
VNTLEKQPAKNLELNEIGECNIAIDRKIVFDPYEENRDTGSFILIDRLTNATVGMGMIRFALRRASNIHWQAMDVSKVARSRMKDQKPVVLWFTGLSGSGKSTIANMLEKKLSAIGKHTFTLDGDNVRHGLNRDLGFTDADRVENIRRVTEVARLMTEAGIITLVSFISPFRSERRMARQIMQDGEFLEIFVDTPLEVAEARDVKGLYKKARAGEIKNFTGIDSPYEPPETAEITVNTVQTSAEEAADHIIVELEQRGILDPNS